MAMAERANERIDLMDVRCDKMEDEHEELKRTVFRFQKEMEDMQLEKQIETLRRELEEAKTGTVMLKCSVSNLCTCAGVFLKATARMDAMQEEANQLKEQINSAQGQVQVNRESIQDIEDVVRSAGVDIGSSSGQGSTKALIAQLQSDVSAVCSPLETNTSL